jgi:PAS domain S-box-containing protein
MIFNSTTDFIENLNIKKSLYSQFEEDNNLQVSTNTIQKGMLEVYDVGNKVMLGVIGFHFILSIIFASITNNWITPIITNIVFIVSFSLLVKYTPHHLWTRIIAGIILQGYGLLFLYQLNGISEARFFFFTSFTFLIVYQDSKALYPSGFLFLGQLLLLATLSSNVEKLTFITQEYEKLVRELIPRNADKSINVIGLWLYISIGLFQMSIVSLWAQYLRKKTIMYLYSKEKIIQTQKAIEEANKDLEHKILEKTKELQIALETTQANEEELRQNIEEIQAAQEELESQRRKLLENQTNMLEAEQKLLAQQKKLEEEQWVENQLNKLDDIMHEYDDKSMRDFADAILLFLAQTTAALRGAFYIYDNLNDSVKIIGGYACTPETLEKNTFKAGEGIVGQIIKTRKILQINQLPEDSVLVESALSKVKSKSLILVPLLYNNEMQGVIEFSSLNVFEDLHIILLTRASKNIAATLQNLRSIQNTQNLLIQSQQITLELETKTAELQRTKTEIEQKTLEYQRQFDAIDNSLMVMVCSIDGEITKINDKFAKTAEYSKEELEHKHFSIFFPEHIIQSQSYRMLAKNVRKQDFFEGEYECISKNKKTFWIRAFYYTIGDGKNKKMMVLAYNITKEKEQERQIKEQLATMEENQALLHQNIDLMKILQEEKDLQSKELEEQMQAINFTFGMATFDLKGKLKSYNDKFADFLETSQNIKQKNIRDLLDMRTDEAVAFPEWWESLKNNEVLQGNYAFMTEKQKTIWIYGTFYPVTDAMNYVKQIIFLGIEK